MNRKPLKPRSATISRQELLLLNMLRRGEVTRLAAITAGIANVTARIADLRARGFDVVATMNTDTLGRRYARWSLVQREQVAEVA